MKWEYIGAQQLPDRKGKVRRTIRPEMWRARVPGGWLLLMSNSYDVKSPAFCPDLDHAWEIEADEPQSPAKTLLRPSAEQRRLTKE